MSGPFNLWSLKGWGKEGVALLGTGTDYQFKQLLDIKCKGFVLALDPDEAGIKATKKLKQFLQNHKRLVHVAQVPVGKDINDLTEDEFKNMIVI